MCVLGNQSLGGPPLTMRYVSQVSPSPPPAPAEYPQGFYGIEDLIKLLEEAANTRSERVAISTNRVNGLLTLTVGNGWEVLLIDGLLMLFGLDNCFGGHWLDAGMYTGDRPVNFATTKSLRLHLIQLNISIKCFRWGPVDTSGSHRHQTPCLWGHSHGQHPTPWV